MAVGGILMEQVVQETHLQLHHLRAIMEVAMGLVQAHTQLEAAAVLLPLGKRHPILQLVETEELVQMHLFQVHL